jgi:hypothetical protein
LDKKTRHQLLVGISKVTPDNKIQDNFISYYGNNSLKNNPSFLIDQNAAVLL